VDPAKGNKGMPAATTMHGVSLGRNDIHQTLLNMQIYGCGWNLRCLVHPKTFRFANEEQWSRAAKSIALGSFVARRNQ
jgi:hypothetical protein